MTFIDSKYHIWLLAVVCFFIFFVNLDVLYANIMEARNFITAREMVTDGQWILTKMNGLPRYEKPPLPTWFAAISGMVFGFKNLMLLRLPSAIIALIMVIFAYRLSAYLVKDKQQALVSSLVMATSFYIIFAGRNGTWDIFAHGFMLIAIYYLFCFFSSESELWKNGMLAGVFIGLSFMSKGPVSHYALLIPFLIAYGLTYKYNRMNGRWFPLSLSLIVVGVLSSWWFYYIYVFDTGAAEAIATKETLAWKDRSVKPFYHYWSFFVQSGVWTIPALISLLYPYLKTRVIDLRAYRFTLLWTLTSVILLSFIPEKKERYLMPVMIPLALNIGFYIEYLFRKFSALRDKRELIPVYFNFGLIAIVGLVFPFGGYWFLNNGLDGFYGWFIVVSIALFAIAVLMLHYLRKKQIRHVFYLTILFKTAILTLGFPLANAFLDNPDYNDFATLAKRAEKTNTPVYILSTLSPEIIWDFGKTIPLIENGEILNLPEGNDFMVLTKIGHEEKLRKLFQSYTVVFKETMDINPVNNSQRGYKDRLRAELYNVSR